VIPGIYDNHNLTSSGDLQIANPTHEYLPKPAPKPPHNSPRKFVGET
jgi:hypothetical protein